jgi:RNA polymerase sigma factor (sigma-70 family)
MLRLTRQCYDEGRGGKVTVDDEFEAHRDHLRAVAYRLLGSAFEADDAVQETWLRLARAETDDVRNLRGWLTTVLARVCVDMLRARIARREMPLALDTPLATVGPDPEQEAVLAESVGLALLIVLDRLSPAERVAFVLHDTFAVPFEQIAPVLGRSVPATKMLASRARHRVRGGAQPESDPAESRRLVEAFLAAARAGDFAALLELLDPEVIVRADAFAAPVGTPGVVRGAAEVGRQALAFARRARHARVGLVDGAPAILVEPRDRLVTVMRLETGGGRIVGIEIIADPQRLATMAG